MNKERRKLLVQLGRTRKQLDIKETEELLKLTKYNSRDTEAGMYYYNFVFQDCKYNIFSHIVCEVSKVILVKYRCINDHLPVDSFYFAVIADVMICVG